jgi:2-polyprenyl-6-hydroxyphenyl methylase/3-demethylubiquinone-9 3-methyltransferase
VKNVSKAMSKAYYAQKLSAERLQRVYDIAGPRVKQYLEAEIDHVASFVRSGDRILELGCGYGRALVPVVKIAGSGWGVDNSFQSLKMGQSQGAKLFLAVMDAGSLGFSDTCFDLVFGIQNFISACKVPPGHLLRECLRVTRPGGKILLSSYAAEFWPHRLEWFRQQAAHGLLGPIDERKTGDGVIVCEDGFRATTFSPKEFEDFCRSNATLARVYTVDRSSVFCDILAHVPGGLET